MNVALKTILLLGTCLIFTGCSGEDDSNNTEAKKDHVWKEQTDTINKAKEVEGMIMDSAADTRNKIEQQSE